MRQRPWIAFVLACVTSSLAACFSFGDLSGGDDGGASSPDASGADANALADASSSDAAIVDLDADAGFIPTPDGSCGFNTPFGTPTLLNVNSAMDDWGPRLSPDERTLYFASSRANHGDGGAGIFTANRTSVTDDFSTPTLMPNINGPYVAVHPTVTADGLNLYFQSNQLGPNDIFLSTRANLGDNFGAPILLPNINSATEQDAPFVRADGTVIYFSQRASAPAKLQIRRAVASAGSFAAAASEDEINSPNFDTTFPTVTPDDLTIFFASDNPKASSGGYDMWMAERASTSDAFSDILPLTHMNSAGGDYPAWVSADRCTLYFFSNRSGSISIGTGNLDMYVTTRPK
ncbi:MAG: hypothetical protein ABI183_14065 [Polyangiaceae bacterium]